MLASFISKRKTLSHKILSALTLVSFAFTVFLPANIGAQNISSVLNLPVPGTVVSTTPSFSPVMIKGIQLYSDHPLKFDFIINKGDTQLTPEEFKIESTKLIKYFLVSLTVPEEEMWVNLSPYQKDRIVPKTFGSTEMGRDLLAQDYMLKQIAASLMDPQTDLGQQFWERIQEKTRRVSDSLDVMNTFNKVWIVPEKAVIYENEKGAFVVNSQLKVMLEEDYLALEANKNSIKHGLGDVKKEELKIISGAQSQIIKDIIIPEIEKEVNHGKTFANLRQIYNAVILASWYKQVLKESLLGQVYVDRKKTKGSKVDQEINEKIYNQYVESFKKGIHNFIKEEYDPKTQSVVPKKYFSGGASVEGTTKLVRQGLVRGPASNEIRNILSSPAVRRGNVRTIVDLGMLAPDNEALRNRLGYFKENKEVVVITMKDGRLISGKITKMTDEELSLEGVFCCVGDFDTPSGKTKIILNDVGFIVEGLPGTTNVVNYLQSLTTQQAQMVRDAFLTKKMHYSEIQQVLWDDMKRLIEDLTVKIQGLKQDDRTDKLVEGVQLTNFILSADDNDQIKRKLNIGALVDRQSEALIQLKKVERLLAEITKGETSDIEQTLKNLVDVLQQSKWLKDFELRMADGIVRTKVYHTETEDIDTELERKFGTKELDLIVIGGGPAGLAAMTHAVALGEKTVMLEAGYAAQSFSDYFMQAVHWMRSNSYENSLVRDSLPALVTKFGLDENLTAFRLLGNQARSQMETMTGNRFVGMPPHADELNGINAIIAPNARNELFQHFMEVLDYVAKKGFVQEQSPVVNVERRASDGKYVVTTRDGYQYVSQYIHIAPGMVGSNAEYTRQSRFLAHQKGSYLVLGNVNDMSNPSKAKELAEINSDVKSQQPMRKQLIFSDPILGNARIKEILDSLERLPQGERMTVAVIGDGESAVKAAREIVNLNDNLDVELFIKRPLLAARLHIPGDARELSRKRIGETIRSADLMAAGLKAAKAYPHAITQRTYQDILELQEDGRLRMHVLNNKYFDENTVELEQITRPDGVLVTRVYTKLNKDGQVVLNEQERNPKTGEFIQHLQKLDVTQYEKMPDGRYLLAEITGPMISAVGYNMAALQNSGIVKIMQENDILPSTIQTVDSDNNLTIGFEGVNNNPFFSGPAFGNLSIVHMAIPSHAAVGLEAAKLRRIRKYQEQTGRNTLEHPFLGAAIRINSNNQELTAQENDLHIQVMAIIHDDDFVKVVGQDAAPKIVYKALEQKKEIGGVKQYIVPEVEETDPVRMAYLHYALRAETNLELIPYIAEYLNNIDLFLSKLSDESLAQAGVSPQFAKKVASLRAFHQANSHVNISDLIVHPGYLRRILYMDPNDYELLFKKRSQERRNVIVEEDGERHKMQPLIVPILQDEFVDEMLELPVHIEDSDGDVMSPLSEAKKFLSEHRKIDSGMISHDVGGIDFNSAMINMKRVKDEGVKLPAFQMTVPAVNSVDGIVPNIIQTIPITDLPFYLGISSTPQDKNVDMAATLEH